MARTFRRSIAPSADRDYAIDASVHPRNDSADTARFPELGTVGPTTSAHWSAWRQRNHGCNTAALCARPSIGLRVATAADADAVRRVPMEHRSIAATAARNDE